MPPVGPPPSGPSRAARRLALAGLSSLALLALLRPPLALGRPSSKPVTFVFQDAEQAPADGLVLAEFPELLFVQLEGNLPGFLRRAELAAVVDEQGRRIETPPIGTLAPVSRVLPVAAVTEVGGVAWLRAPDAPETAAPTEGPPGVEGGAARAGEQALPEQEGGAVFLVAGAGVRTGDNGMVRGVFPSGAELWLGVRTRVSVHGEGAEGIEVHAGEATLETRLRPLALRLARPLLAQLEAGSRLAIVAEAPGLDRFEQHAGRSQLAWPELSLVLDGGHGLEVEELGSGRWRLRAGETNPDAIDLMVSGRLEELPPGAERVIGAELVPQRDLWRVLSARGELLLRRGAGGSFTALGPVTGEVPLGPGDGLRTPAGGEALLARVDGARLTLREATHLEVDEALELVRGRALLEALDAPVRLGTPGGVAGFDHTVVQLERLGAGEAAVGPGDALHVEAVAGRPVLPLGSAASLRVEERGKTSVAREALPQGSPSAALAPLALRQLAGAARLRSRELDGRGDASWTAELAQGDDVRVLPPDGAAPGAEDAEAPPPRQPFGALALPGRRLLRFIATGTQAEVLVTAGHLRFPQRPHVELAEGLTLDVGRQRDLPLVRFKSGETLLLRDAVPLRVENPTIEVRGRGARVKLDGGVQLRVQEAGAHGAAALGTRDADHLELRPERGARLAQEQDQVRYTLDDGRALWIQPKAPPVDARLGDAAGSLFLSMPGAPSLGLRPDRRLTVLATNEGEFIVLDRDQVGADAVEALGLDADAPSLGLLQRDRLAELLDVPREDSPSGP